MNPLSGHRFLVAGIAVAGLLLSVDTFAMRCGNKLISKGDTQAKVLKYCGEPVQKTQKLGLRAAYYRGQSGYVTADGSVQRGYYYPYGHIEVLIESWIFNFGPYQLMRQVSFADGFVEDVETLGYGYLE